MSAQLGELVSSAQGFLDQVQLSSAQLNFSSVELSSAQLNEKFSYLQLCKEDLPLSHRMTLQRTSTVHSGISSENRAAGEFPFA